MDTVSIRHLSQPGIVNRYKISIAIKALKKLLFSVLDINSAHCHSDYKLLIIFKIKTKNNKTRSISYIQFIEICDAKLDKLIKIFIEFWELKTEDDYLAEVIDIIFTYKIVPSIEVESKWLISDESGLPIIKDKERNTEDLSRNKISRTSFGGVNLPNTMDIELWGDVQYI